MAHRSDPVDVDPEQVENARTMWDRFMFFTKWAIIATTVLLVLLALLLL